MPVAAVAAVTGTTVNRLQKVAMAVAFCYWKQAFWMGLETPFGLTGKP